MKQIFPELRQGRFNLNKDLKNMKQSVNMVQALSKATDAGQAHADGSGVQQQNVLDYRSCDDETRALMDEHIDRLDPYDMTSLIAFGQDALQSLGDVARQVRDRFEQDETLLSLFAQAEEKLGSIDIAALADTAAGMGVKGFKYVKSNPGTALATAVTFALAGPFAAAGVPFAKHRIDQARARRKGGDLAEELRRSIQETEQTKTAIQSALLRIPEAIASLNTLGQARVEAYDAISFDVGCGLERLRRIDEDEIPVLEARLEQSPDNQQLLMDLENLRFGRNLLDQRINDMLASRAVSQATVVTLGRLKSVFMQAHGKLSTHMTVSFPQWEAQMAEAGVQIIASKVTEVSAQADKRGAEMLALSGKLAEQTTKMMQESAARGTYDTQQVIAVLEQITTSLGSELKQIGSVKANLADSRQMLIEASETFTAKMRDLQARANSAQALPAPNAGRTSAAALTDRSNKSYPANDAGPV